MSIASFDKMTFYVNNIRARNYSDLSLIRLDQMFVGIVIAIIETSAHLKIFNDLNSLYFYLVYGMKD